MILSRRAALVGGGGFAAFLLAARTGQATGPTEIAMRGSKDGGRVSFDPVGLYLEPGQRVIFVNRDDGNSHTATAYTPAIDGRSLRIPSAGAGWDSDYLDPGGSFEIMLESPGVYDFYCRPHEHAGMVGRIVVGRPESHAGWTQNEETGDLDPVALAAFPEVEKILAMGSIAASW
jgi:plastocyanin